MERAKKIRSFDNWKATVVWLATVLSIMIILFLAIETTPIFAKLISPRGEYDLRLADAEGELTSWVTQKANQRKNLIDADNVVNDKVYGDLAQEDELYNYKKKMARDLMQKQQDAFYKKQSKLL